MGKQINFYLPIEDFTRIASYLQKRKCIFIEDVIFDEPKPLLAPALLTSVSSKKYIAFQDKTLFYNACNQENQFRLQQMISPVMEFGIYGKKEGFYRARFFYEPVFSENGEYKTKDTEFEAFVDRFFRWFHRTYQRIPESPFFFQNPKMPVKELF